jgi:hypothetical protein
MRRHTLSALAILALAGPALADYSITQGSDAPTYTSKVLNFDEAGGPEGVVPATAWLETHGLSIDAGDGVPQVGDFDAAQGGWGLGEGNSFYGNFGVFMTFQSDLTALSVQVWDPSGPPGPFGGGLYVYLFNDGVQVDVTEATPAWGGVGAAWFDMVASEGDVFDEVRILGFGFPPTTFVDNLSWELAGQTTCPGDANGDGLVDVTDLVAVITAWGSADPGADLDGNGVVDVADMVEVIVSWGSC